MDNKKNSINFNLDFILVSSVIIISISPLFENIQKILFTFICIVALIIIRGSKMIFLKRNIYTLLILTVILLINGFLLDLIYAQSFDPINLGFWVLIFLGFMFSSLKSKKEILLVNEKLMHYTLVLGIPIFFLVSYFPSLINYTLDYTYGGYNHKTLFFVNFHYVEDNFLSNRFVGIGREPGVTQIFLVLAVYSRLKRILRIDFKVLILILGILLGKSTAGFFTLFLIIFITLPIKKSLKYTLFFSPIIVYFLYDQFIYHFDNKLVGSIGFVLRYSRYLNFFDQNLSEILLGFGNYYYSNIISSSDIGGWDTFLQLSQRYGVISFIILCLIIIANNKNFKTLTFILILSFFSQLVWFYPIISFFYFNDNANA